MAEEVEIAAEQRRQVWLGRLAEEFIKVAEFMPDSKISQAFTREEGCPQWVEHVETEIASIMMPVLRLKEGWELTPKRVGALLGHQCANAVWLMEWIESSFITDGKAAQEAIRQKEQHEANSHKATEDLKRLEAADLAKCESFLRSLIEEWYPRMRRLAKLALCSSVDQSYQDMTDFLNGYSASFARKPQSFRAGDLGNTTFEIYVILLLSWRAVTHLKSVHQLHAVLVSAMGNHRVGELKRVEKICQRIGLHYRKPGRPKKSE